jgi:copper chaperone NosL
MTRRVDGAPRLQTRGDERPLSLKTQGSILTTLFVLATACGSAVPLPAALDTVHEPCGFCRMIVSDQRFASQIVAPYEEPRFFDDMGCLTNYLTNTPALPNGAVVYVADHRTKAWVRAGRAIYTRVGTLAAPMTSHIVAHESAASRDADPDATTGTPVALSDVLPGGRPPGGSE